MIFSARGTSPLLAWTRVPVPCKTLNSPQRGQVHYTDAAAGASNDRGRFISSSFVFLKLQLNRAGVPHAQLLHFYLAVIRPVLEYAAPVWIRLINPKRIRLKQYKRRQYEFSCACDMPYTSALFVAGLEDLDSRRDLLSHNLFESILSLA